MSAIVVDGLTKRFGDTTVVDELSFAVPAGAVTGFVGANGSGKTTSMRMMLGLTRPTSGRTLFGDGTYADLASPRRTVGAVLDRLGAHPGISGRTHLQVIAASAGSGPTDIDAALTAVGLDDAANRLVGTYSTGMGQRLSLATALLFDPDILILDEPARGLDPNGIHWLRNLLRTAADAGKTVFVSTHQLAELDSIVDHLVVIEQGRLAFDGAPQGLLERTGQQSLSAAVFAATSDKELTP